MFHYYAKQGRISSSMLLHVNSSWLKSAYLHRNKDKDGQIPLHTAAEKSDKGIIAVMGHLAITDSNALMWKRNCWGYTPLHWAIKNNCDPDLVNQIIGKILPSKRLKILKRQLIKPSPHGYSGVKGDNLLHTICQTERRLVYIKIIRHWISDRQFLKLM